MTEPATLTDRQAEKLLTLIRANPQLGTVAALKQLGIKASRQHARQLTVELGEAYEEARGRGHERIRQEIQRRAIDGVDEPVYQGGEQVGVIRRYSDRLLLALAKAQLPEYRDRVELTGADGGPVQLEDRSASLADVARILETVGALAQHGRGAAREALPAPRKVLSAPEHD